MEVVIKKSSNNNKKFDAIIDGKKKISFGASGYSDYTKHKDNDRKNRYIDRHKSNEDWTKSGIRTPGFMSKNLLWNKPTLEASIKDLNKKYKDINFKYKK